MTPQWMWDAECAQVDPELFFPPEKSVSKVAKKICGECPVQAACLEYALRSDQTAGIWGGMTTKERKRVR
jgi:WhiB family redox-sensing transcriptional regulator